MSERNRPGGPHPVQETGGLPPLGRPPISWAPWWASGVHLLLYHHFYPEKIVGKLTRRNSAATRRNLGRINLGLWRSCSARDTYLPMRGSMVMISPSRREVSQAEQLRQSPRLIPPRFRLVAVEFRPVSLPTIFSG